jgi:hypothetical protein
MTMTISEIAHAWPILAPPRRGILIAEPAQRPALQVGALRLA